MATPKITAIVCSCGNVMPKRIRDEETGRYAGEWCGHIGTGVETTFYPQSVVEELFDCAIGNDDHDPRCDGACGPCGGVGGVPDTGPNGEMALTCLTCGGSGKCGGCSVGFRLRRAESELTHLRKAEG